MVGPTLVSLQHGCYFMDQQTYLIILTLETSAKLTISIEVDSSNSQMQFSKRYKTVNNAVHA